MTYEEQLKQMSNEEFIHHICLSIIGNAEFTDVGILEIELLSRLESKLSSPLTDEEIKTEASKYAVERHGLGEEWQPDRLESMFSFEAGAKFYRDKQ